MHFRISIFWTWELKDSKGAPHSIQNEAILLSEWVGQPAEEWVRAERTGSIPPTGPPATCKRHMCTTPAPQHCHLAKHLACNRAARTAHIALTSDMTRPAQLLHASCHIRRLDVKKTWVDAALCGRRTFPRWTPPADHQLSAGAARVPSETFWRTPNLKHGGSFF